MQFLGLTPLPFMTRICGGHGMQPGRVSWRCDAKPDTKLANLFSIPRLKATKVQQMMEYFGPWARRMDKSEEQEVRLASRRSELSDWLADIT